MKHSLALMFFKVAARDDPYHNLKSQGLNSRFVKRLEFTNVKTIKNQEISSWPT